MIPKSLNVGAHANLRVFFISQPYADSTATCVSNCHILHRPAEAAERARLPLGPHFESAAEQSTLGTTVRIDQITTAAGHEVRNDWRFFPSLAQYMR
jgi:hypothetical protein